MLRNLTLTTLGLLAAALAAGCSGTTTSQTKATTSGPAVAQTTAKFDPPTNPKIDDKPKPPLRDAAKDAKPTDKPKDAGTIISGGDKPKDKPVEPEPRYKGRPMSDWLLDLEDANELTSNEAEPALAAIGEPAWGALYNIATKAKVRAHARDGATRALASSKPPAVQRLREMLKSQNAEVAYCGAWGIALAHHNEPFLKKDSEDLGAAITRLAAFENDPGVKGSVAKAYLKTLRGVK